MTNSPLTSFRQQIEETFGKKFSHSEECDLQRFRDFEKEPFAGCYCELKDIKSFLLSALTQQLSLVEEEVVRCIDENVKLASSTHRIGSHSDDFGGESDYPCDCDDAKKRHQTQALENLKKKVLTRLKSGNEKTDDR